MIWGGVNQRFRERRVSLGLRWWWSWTGLLVYEQFDTEHGPENQTVFGLHFWPPKVWKKWRRP
jgi:hypothetical protein